MSEPIYKIVEITGTSAASIEDAVQNALARAAKTVRQMRWFEVTEVRGSVEEDHVGQWQVTVKLGFKLDD